MSRSQLASAALPGGAGRGQDRHAIADDLVIVLDGASAFDKDANPDATDYVDHLATALVTQYTNHPGIELAEGLASAIHDTATTLALVPGAGPSSTVAVLRWNTNTVDALVLGDSTIIIGTAGSSEVLTDDALAAIAPEVRARYRDRLRAGGGFTAEHRADLAELQRHQAAWRNRPGGYWIAEADPEAAGHAEVRTWSAREVQWAIAATDGAQRPAEYLGYGWDAVTKLDADGLFDLLVDLHHWESTDDPDGRGFPRSKRHDDKTLATARFSLEMLFMYA